MFIFGSAMAENTGNDDGVTFWNAIFEIYNYRTPNQITFLESWDKIEQGHKIFFFSFKMSPFLDWTWPDLLSVVKMRSTIEFHVQNEP